MAEKRKRKKTTVKLQANGLTRREELYLSIIGRMVSRHLTFDGKWLSIGDTPRDNGMYLENKYAVGDLVLTYSSIGHRHNPWNIAIVHELRGFGECALRDIFTGQICNYGNEDFKKIVGVPFEVQLDEEQYALWSTFNRACYKAEGEFRYYLIPLYATFEESQITYVTREKWSDDLMYHVFSRGTTEEEMETTLRILVQGIQEARKQAMAKKDEEDQLAVFMKSGI